MKGKCWCGEKNAYFSEEPFEEGGCGGAGVFECYCGGDFCVCHNHGEVECPGCDDCEADQDEDDGPFDGCNCHDCIR